MSFFYEERRSSSPLIESIWHTRGESSGCHLAIADGSWDFIVIRLGDEISMFVAGASTQAAPIHYEPGIEYVGIRMKIGAFMPLWPASDVLNNMVQLPQATRNSFWLQDSMLEIPTFENVEAFMGKLVRNRLVTHDPIIEASLEGDPNLSLRSVQRHFLNATGVTQAMLRQIERARYAQTLLLEGKPILETVFAAGFTDQPHMTKAMKQFIGLTPGQIIGLNQSR
ncbi:MAG: AraC family transcriptional regulator [Anaerolineae bacterium]|nr:AraC family transcriptional regulator [Anaerolineae bacterium]